MTERIRVPRITEPNAGALDQVAERLRESAVRWDKTGGWPGESLRVCAEAGVFEWFVPESMGGQGWAEADILRAYLKLSAACLTSSFVITQFSGACRRLASSENRDLQRQLLPELVSGRAFATLGISHLTTSRRHLSEPVLRAECTAGGYRLDGYSPWVTGAKQADYMLTGATLGDGQQILLLLPTDLPGVTVSEAEPLVGLTSSQTGPVHLEGVELLSRWLLAGPAENIMNTGIGGRTGSLETTALAAGLAGAALEFVAGEADQRTELKSIAAKLREDWKELCDRLLAVAAGEVVGDSPELRSQANSLVLRASQAALAAAKGSGFIVGHPAGRWCREALFFLVWSCPQPVMMAHLHEMAGLNRD